MQIAFWNELTDKHIKDFRTLYQQSNHLCLECNKPLKYRHYLCTSCIKKLRLSGLEVNRVGYKQVGLSTVNYQQYLHRSMFNCNAPFEYRGLRLNRIVSKVSQSTIDKSCKLLENYFLYQTKVTQQQDLYLAVKDYRNTNRRLLYSITLYAISYFILNNKDFKSFCHFQASICRQLDNDLVRMNIRIHRVKVEKNNTRDRTMKDMIKQYKVIELAITNMLVELV